MLSSVHFFRKWLYEPFLRIHQILAGLIGYSIFRHLAITSLEWNPSVPKLYAYIFALTFFSTFAIHAIIVIYRNWPIKSKFSRAYITHGHDVINVRLELSRPLRVEAGQYICLWIPISSLGFWNFCSFFQSHPFTVTSWSEKEQRSLDLLIESRGGLTRKLLTYSKVNHGGSDRLALFTGPHGISVPIEEYETVLLIASGFGIAAQLPYLKRLIYGYNTCKTRTRRVHLVWQLKTIGKFQSRFEGDTYKAIDMGIAVQSLLNNALDDDTLDEGYVSSATRSPLSV